MELSPLASFHLPLKHPHYLPVDLVQIWKFKTSELTLKYHIPNSGVHAQDLCVKEPVLVTCQDAKLRHAEDS